MKITFGSKVATLTLAALCMMGALGLSASTFAGDASTATALGFSSDGKSFAYIEYGYQDGSGFPYAAVKFLDVAKNTYAAPTVSVVKENESANARQVRYEALLKARPALSKLGISKGNIGELLASRKLTDLSSESTSKVRFSRHPIIRGLTSTEFELSLEEKAARSTRCVMGESPVMMKLTLKNVSSSKSIELQNDTALPMSRGCVKGYRIQDVIAREEGDREVIVLLNIFTTGFEGDDSRTIAVSGTLPQ